MNSQIARKRIGDVIRVDTITSSRADFMATHVEVRNIQIAKSYEGKAERTLNEEEAFNKYVLNPDNKHQLVLVVGLSGTGKSHLIRWFSTKLEREHGENEVVLFIRRSDNSLKGTIQQLLQLDEVANIPNKDIYDRLSRATTVIDNKKLKDMIYQNFIVEINNDENDEILTHHKKRRLVALLQNASFQERLLADDKGIDRIYQKVASSKTGDSRDVVALFDANDFYVDADFCESLVRDGADRNAQTMAKLLTGDTELAGQIASYMNTLVNNVIQTCAGLEPGDFEQVFLEIRKELKRQGKTLTLLIEDITAFTGVNVALLNVLSLENTGMYQDLCRISSIIGTTTAYFEDVFPANYRDRVTNYLRISDDAFGSDQNALCEFVGRYLNTMSLDTDELEDWMNGGAVVADYPVHHDVEGNGWERIGIKGKKSLNLFPFTKTAVVKLFSLLPEHQKTPRYLLRDIVERGVRNYLAGADRFPSFSIERSEIYPWNPVDHRGLLMQYAKDAEFDRMDMFIRIWGDANLFATMDYTGKKYIGGIPEAAYKEFKMIVIPGIQGNSRPEPMPGPKHDSDSNPEPDPEPGPDHDPQPKPAQPSAAEIAFQQGVTIIYKWMQGGSLNFDSTKKDVKMMQQARDEMNRYIFNAINWQIEGISVDNISKYTSKDFIEFERQSKKVGKSLVVLPADPDTQSVLEAFVAFVTFGEGKTWNFEGAAWRQYQVQKWFEKIKPQIIKKIKCFNDIEVDYQRCAISAEVIREIIFGQYKGSKLEEVTDDMLLKNAVRGIPANSAHSKEWISLMTNIYGNAKRVRDTIINYYNLVQGSGGSKIYLNHSLLESDFKKLRKTRFIIDDAELAERDPFKPRQEIRDIYKDIVGNLQRVSTAELTLAGARMAELSQLIDITDIDDEDLEDLVDAIESFYDEANKTHVNVKYDSALIAAIRKDIKPIANAISNVSESLELTDSLDVLMAFSQDPLLRIDKLLSLLNKAAKDVEYVKQDVQKRKEKAVQGTGGESSGRYVAQRLLIDNNLQTAGRWGRDNAAG